MISDEAYEDIVFDGEHVSIASLPGMYERTIPLLHFQQVVRDDRAAARVRRDQGPVDPRTREEGPLLHGEQRRSVVQYGGIGALEGPQDCIGEFRSELRTRRDLFYRMLGELRFGRFHRCATSRRVLRISAHRTGCVHLARGDAAEQDEPSLSWRMAEYLIENGRIGCVPGVDFGTDGEGYVRFCFARERKELTGALESMKELFGATTPAAGR